MPALTLHHPEADSQEANKADTPVRGYTHSSVHIIPAEALGHTAAEKPLKESHTSRIDHDYLNGK